MNWLFKVVLTIFVFLCFISGYSQNKTSEQNRNFIAVLYVKLDMNSFVRVECNHFAEIFENSLSIQKVTDKDSLKKFISIMKTIKFENDHRQIKIDVRRKFIYSSNDVQKNIICSDGRNIMVDGRLIKRNRTFIKFLESMCSDVISW